MKALIDLFTHPYKYKDESELKTSFIKKIKNGDKNYKTKQGFNFKSINDIKSKYNVK